MLVLSRNKQEKIKINDDITITIVDIKRNKVKIGIEAPLSTKVHREEIYNKIKEEESGGNNG
jgi:carbon storage regulator